MLIRIHLIHHIAPFYTYTRVVAEDEGRKDLIGRRFKYNQSKLDSDNTRPSSSPSLIYYTNDNDAGDDGGGCALLPSSSFSKKTIDTRLQERTQEDDAPNSCNDAVAYAWIEQRISQQDNISAANMNKTRNAAGGDAGATAGAGAGAGADTDNRKRHALSIDSKEREQEQEHVFGVSRQQLEEDWFKGTSFYQDPGTPPLPPPKDYISVNFNFGDDDDNYDSDDDDDTESFSSQEQPTRRRRLSQSVYSVAISSKIGSSLLSGRKSIAGKVRNAIIRGSSFLSHA